VHDAVQLKVRITAAAIVEEQHRTVFRSVFLQRKHLAAIEKRVLGKHPYLGKSIDHQSVRFPAFDLGHDGLDTIVEFDLGRMEDCVLPVGLQVLFAWAYFEYCRFLDGQSVVLSDGEKFIARFRESDVEDLFAAFHPFGNELQSKGRLPCAGFPLD
jgi:hypothetical protein